MPNWPLHTMSAVSAPSARTSAIPAGQESSLAEDLPLSTDLSVEMADLFSGLADPNRARIVHALVHEDMTTSGLAELLGMNKPSVSQHLRTLRMLRLIKSRREGQFVLYSVDDEHVRLLVNLTLTHLREGRPR